MRDIRIVCGADTAVYEKLKSLIFTLELSFEMEMKDTPQCFLALC